MPLTNILYLWWKQNYDNISCVIAGMVISKSNCNKFAKKKMNILVPGTWQGHRLAHGTWQPHRQISVKKKVFYFYIQLILNCVMSANYILLAGRQSFSSAHLLYETKKQKTKKDILCSPYFYMVWYSFDIAQWVLNQFLFVIWLFLLASIGDSFPKLIFPMHFQVKKDQNHFLLSVSSTVG